MAKKKSSSKKKPSRPSENQKSQVKPKPQKPAKIVKSIFLNRKMRLAISIGLTALYYVIFQFPANLDESCYIGGDTWEYHAMGVNLAKGHGVNKFGAFEPFETYKFTWGDDRKVQNFNKRKRDNFLRTPGYPFFLGVTYKIFGVNVKVVKHLQLLMIAFIAGFIPLFGKQIGDLTGYLTGLLAGPLIMLSMYRTSEMIMTEPLTALAVFGICFAIANSLKKKNLKSGLILGGAIGAGLLVKGALIFIPAIILAVFIVDAIQSKSFDALKVIGGMLIGVAVFVMPWSWYATNTRGKFTFLSTQSKELLLDCNNELSQDGSWHPEYRKDKANKDIYYHNQKRLRKKSSLQKVITYYSEYPDTIKTTFFNKLHLGINPFPFLWLVFFGMLIEGIRRLMPGHMRKGKLFPMLGILAVIGAALYVFPNSLHRYVEDGNIYGNRIMPRDLAVTASLLFIIASIVSAFRRKREFLDISLVFFVILSNFILLTLVFYGSVRFIKVADFVFVFFALFLPVKWLIELVPSIPDRLKLEEQDVPVEKV